MPKHEGHKVHKGILLKTLVPIVSFVFEKVLLSPFEDGGAGEDA